MERKLLAKFEDDLLLTVWLETDDALLLKVVEDEEGGRAFLDQQLARLSPKVGEGEVGLTSLTKNGKAFTVTGRVVRCWWDAQEVQA